MEQRVTPQIVGRVQRQLKFSYDLIYPKLLEYYQQPFRYQSSALITHQLSKEERAIISSFLTVNQLSLEILNQLFSNAIPAQKYLFEIYYISQRILTDSRMLDQAEHPIQQFTYEQQLKMKIQCQFGLQNIAFSQIALDAVMVSFLQLLLSQHQKSAVQRFRLRNHRNPQYKGFVKMNDVFKALTKLNLVLDVKEDQQIGFRILSNIIQLKESKRVKVTFDDYRELFLLACKAEPGKMLVDGVVK